MAPRPAHRCTGKPTGRPPIYSSELAADFLSEVALGNSISSICAKPSMPSRFTIQQWERTDIDGFSAKFARAREEGAHVLAMSVIDIADEQCPAGLEGAQATAWEQQRKSRIDARKWFVSKILPRVYGDRVDVNVTTKTVEELSLDELLRIAAAGRPLIEGSAETVQVSNSSEIND